MNLLNLGDSLIANKMFALRGRSRLVAPATRTALETQLPLQVTFLRLFGGEKKLLSAKLAKGLSLRWTHARQISCLLKSNTEQGCKIPHKHTHTRA